MQRLPRVAAVSFFVGLIVCGVLFLSVSKMLPLVPVLPEQGTSDAARPQKSLGATTPRLQFTFTDVAIVPLPEDERENTYTFYIRNQFIGVREMRPENAAQQKSFSAWADGLKGSIRIGEKTVPITRVTIAGYDALTFETTEGDARAANVIAEVDGHILLLQSQTNQQVLEEFLGKIATVRERHS
jgi:hypothetical protein